MNNHIVLTLGRSGSNFLADLINQHPNLLNYGEVLGEWIPMRRVQRRIGLFQNDDAAWLDFLLGNPLSFYGAQTIRAINHLRRGSLLKIRSRKTIASLGIKEFSQNLQRFGLENYLQERPHIKVVSLRRLSALDRTISYLMLKETGVVAKQKGNENAEHSPVTIEPNRFVTALAAVRDENAELERMTSSLTPERVHCLTYEKIFEGSEPLLKLANELYQFLGVEPFKPQIRTRKILPRDPAEVIVNFADCRDAAVRAGYGEPFP